MDVLWCCCLSGTVCLGHRHRGASPLSQFESHSSDLVDEITRGPSDVTTPSRTDEETRALVEAAVRAADSKLGNNIVALDVSGLLSVVDAFVIVSGRNTRQVSTLVEEIEAGVKQANGRSPLRIEGLKDATWVLMDYGDVVMHVFFEETRDYYDLEHLWAGAPRMRTEHLITADRSNDDLAQE